MQVSVENLMLIAVLFQLLVQPVSTVASVIQVIAGVMVMSPAVVKHVSTPTTRALLLHIITSSFLPIQ